MASTTFRLFFFLLEFILTRQEMVNLNTSPTVTAECGQQVVLHCNASSAQDGLSVIHMWWYRDNAILCHVNNETVVTTHQNKSLSDFRCDYEDKRLSLVFERMVPLESGDSVEYRCKLHSNKGMTSRHTKVRLQECCGSAKVVLNHKGPSCTFSQVHPDGDVHWFQGSHNLSSGSVNTQTEKSVDEHGWLTIRSDLIVLGGLQRSGPEPFNCSLKSPTSGRYIKSTVTTSASSRRFSSPDVDAAGTHGPGRILLCILLPLIFTLD